MIVPATMEDEMREPAEWMVQADDRILELLRERGNLTPGVAAHFADLSGRWASKRLVNMRKYGLVTNVGPPSAGLYQITDHGRAYLDEELDASTLDRVDE